MRLAWLCALALVSAAVLPGTLGQRPSDVLGNLPPAGSELAASHYFPEHSVKSFPAGDVISVVVSSRNLGSKPLNLSAIVGSIHTPENFGMHIQNLTLQRYLTPIAPGAEATLEYKFRADPILGATPPREWGLSLHLLYESEGAFFTKTFFNGTAEFSQVPRLVDYELLSLVLTLIALGALGAWAALAYATEAGYVKGRKGSKGKATKSAAPAALDHDEWVKGTSYDVARRKKAAAARRA